MRHFWLVLAAVMTVATSARGLDFQCRSTPRSTASRPHETGPVHPVSDILGRDPTVTVLRSNDLCAPADVDGSNPGAPQQAIHLIRYLLENGAGDGVNPNNYMRPRNVQVDTSLGTFVGNVGTPTHLLVPTAKSIVPNSPPAPLPANAANHYLCHIFDNVRPSVRGTRLTVNDQFSDPTPFNTRLGAPTALCLAASKNNEPVPFPSSHLLCFGAMAGEPGTKKTATIVNRFGTDRVPLAELSLLCVHATL